MNTKLNEIELDFIEFLSERNNRPYNDLYEEFINIKKTYNFSTKKFKQFSRTFSNIFTIIYDDIDEKDIIDSYKFYSPLQLYNFIGYTYQPSNLNYLKYALKLVATGNFKYLFETLKTETKNWTSKFRQQNSDAKTTIVNNTDKNSSSKHRIINRVANTILENYNNLPIIVDYGCGLANISLETARLKKNTKVFLVDIDSIIQEFVRFRFNKYKVDFEFIEIKKNNLYPTLPKHNICIASEVMEHVMQPLLVYKNIFESLDNEGLLYGDFSDHIKGPFHVSSNLQDLRKLISKDFKQLSELMYKKNNVYIPGNFDE